VSWDGAEWGGHIAAAAAAHVLSVSLVAWLLRRRRFSGERLAGATVLRYPPAWHLVAWGFLLLPLGGLGYLAWRFPPKPGEAIYLASLIAGFGLLGAYFVLEVSGVAHELQPNGLLRHGPWRPRLLLPWSQVSALRYSGLASAWYLRTRSGDGAWVPFQLSGIGAFARAALEHVPPEVIDREPGNRVMLARLAVGVPGPGVTHP
jgi:hypothetical protein